MLKLLYKVVMRRHSIEYFWKLREKASSRRNTFGPHLYYAWKYYRYMSRAGAQIPLSARLGKEITFPHGLNGIFISSGASIGDGTVIFHQVTIGSNTLKDSKNYGAPVIGKNVYIGTGAKIIGGISVGDNVRIGANCVVTDDIPANSTVVLQKAKVILYAEPRDNKFIAFSKRVVES